MDQRDFFISYTASDRAWAEQIRRVLTEHGYTVYVQYEDSPYGESIVTWMNRAIRCSRHFIAVWSGGYTSSGHCVREIEAAYLQKVRGNFGLFLPLRVEDIDLEPMYEPFGRVDLFGLDDAQIEERILRAVGYRGPVPTPPAPVQTTDPAPPPIANTSAPAGPSAEELNRRGVDYYWGRNGVQQDYAKARDYYERAAAMGSASALRNLGYLYQKGYGVPQDHAKARDYYEQAAAMGNAAALNDLGYLYQNGYGVPQDYAKARDYFERAADGGAKGAHYNLGMIYEFGLGIPQDDQKALEWYRKAADLGDGAADDKVSKLREKLGL